MDLGGATRGAVPRLRGRRSRHPLRGGLAKMEGRMHNPVSRRMILRLLGGSAALALVPSQALSDTLNEGGFRQNVLKIVANPALLIASHYGQM